MASDLRTIEYIRDQSGLGAKLTQRKMFGEYAIYLDGKVIALVCDDQLFVKPTLQARALLGKVAEAPPYPGAKPYLHLTDEIDDNDLLRAVLLATAKALPAAKPRSARRKTSR
jgi:TfoX/Sxy family transcriptional regulator of competence genes